MLSLAHTIISLPFGLIYSNVWLILALAFSFHFVLDGLLHWNIYPDKHQRFPYSLVALDIIIGLAGAYLLLDTNVFSLPIIAAIIGGNLPDILHTLWGFAGKPKTGWWRFSYPAFRFHDKIQWETKNLPLGLVSQILLITLVTIYIV